MTASLARYLLAIAEQYRALVWVTFDSHHRLVPLLMPWPVAFPVERLN